MITHKELTTLLDYDEKTGVFIWKVRRRGGANKGDRAGRLARDGYVDICIQGKRYLAHRLAWFYIHESWPAHQIDHINCIRSDNRMDNLREAQPFQNYSNRRVQRKGLKGVTWHKSAGKWQAAIKHKGKNHYLGLFESEKEAHEAYCLKARVLHESFWRAS